MDHLLFRGPVIYHSRQWKAVQLHRIQKFLQRIGIKLAFASMNHPESNGAVERANGLIFSAVSKALFDMPKKKRAQELVPSVWGHNISCTRTTGFTPFHLLYGEEAITPEELKLGSFHTEIAATTPVQ
jgi:transposase InsO family protein